MGKDNNIGNRIKFLRENKGFTQKDLALKLGLKSETAVANYEAGYSIPKDEVKFKMCEIFDCSLDYLMCKTDTKNYNEIEKEFRYAYHRDIENSGLTEEEIKDAIRLYKEIKYGKKENN